MSLVEKVLEKMQQQAAQGASTPAPGPRTVAPAAAATPEQPPHPPARTVVIDQDALRAAGQLPPRHQERELARQYRRIKRPLVMKATGRGDARVPNGHLIMLTSALPGEGKTFTSINLAFSMALERDIRVLLVDADVAKPHISRLLGLENERGLLDLLRDESLDVESLILPTTTPRLSILPAGQRTENATELLASERMQQIVTQIGEHDPSRIVIFDSPPLLLTTESQTLAQVMGQIVLVVRAGSTSHQAVLDAVGLLGEGRSVSLVLNQSASEPDSAYYYGYDSPADGSA